MKLWIIEKVYLEPCKEAYFQKIVNGLQKSFIIDEWKAHKYASA